MEKNLKVLSQIATLGLKKQVYMEKIEDEKGFYFLALENGLIGAIYHALQKELMSETLHNRLTKDYFAYLASDVKYQQAIKKLNQILNENKIDHIFLKGSVLKNLYPESYMRAMGDIDLLVREQDVKKVHHVFKENDILLSQRSDAHDLFIMYQEITVEIHPRIYKAFNPKYELLLNKPWDYAVQKELFEFQFKPEYDIIYLLYHLAKHLDSSGIGLRSVLDISIYVKAYEKKMDMTLLKKMLDDTGLNELFTHMLKINEIFFGYKMKHEFYVSPLLSDERYEEILNYIARSGIHGKGKDFNPFEARITSNHMKNRSFFLLLISLIFPRYKTMKGMYPVLEKGWILLPVAWIYRWFHLVFRKGKDTFKKVKQLKVKKTDLEKTKKIFKDLGL